MVRFFLAFVLCSYCFAAPRILTEIPVEKPELVSGIIRYLTKAELQIQNPIEKGPQYYFDVSVVRCLTHDASGQIPSCYFNNERAPRLRGIDVKYFMNYLQLAGAQFNESYGVVHDLACETAAEGTPATCSFTLYK